MPDTAPYASFEAPGQSPRDDRYASIEGPFQLVIAGKLSIPPANDARVLRILDHHAELGRHVELRMGQLQVTCATLTCRLDGWLVLRRAALLCASQASAGTITVRNPGLWTFHAQASGEQPRWTPTNTADFAKTGRSRRPGRRSER